MKKLLFIIPIIFGTFCIIPAHCACAPGDTNCTTKRDGTYSAECQEDGADCSKTGAKTAKCKPIDGTLRCTAHECDNDYYLWFYNGNSMGVCYTTTMAKNYCKNPKYCVDKNCEPKFETKTHYGKSIKAFTGCVKEQIQSTPPTTPDNESSTPTTPQETPADEQKPDASAPENKSGTTVNVTCTEKRKCKTLTIFERIDDEIKYLNDQKLSVWRDANGDFNTARMASDSIAGVVLGTAGGVITSKIVKKNQIKNGFEDLKCTIGGQVVATYGDEFTVGVN